jgi:hypothetical protein
MGTPSDSLAIQIVSVDGMNGLNVEEHQLVVIAGSGNSELEAEGQVRIFLFDPLDECHDLLEEDVVDDSDSFLHVGLDLLAEILGELKGTAAMLISEEALKLGMPVVIPLALLVERQHLILAALVHEVCRQDEDGLLQWSEAADDLRLIHVGDVDVEHLLTPDHLSESCVCSEVVEVNSSSMLVLQLFDHVTPNLDMIGVILVARILDHLGELLRELGLPLFVFDGDQEVLPEDIVMVVGDVLDHGNAILTVLDRAAQQGAVKTTVERQDVSLPLRVLVAGAQSVEMMPMDRVDHLADCTVAYIGINLVSDHPHDMRHSFPGLHPGDVFPKCKFFRRMCSFSLKGRVTHPQSSELDPDSIHPPPQIMVHSSSFEHIRELEPVQYHRAQGISDPLQ